MAVSTSFRLGALWSLPLLALHATALYSSSSPVKKISGSEFNKIINDGTPYIVEFYSDGCGHCRNFVPEYEKAAKALEGIIKVVATDDNAAMGSVGIQGVPAVKARINGQWKDFSGARTASGVVDFAISQLSNLAKGRVSGKSEGSGSKSSGPSEVVVLTDRNFEEKVMNDEKGVWFVKFYAPWCGHCKAMVGDWETTAKELKGKVKVGNVDATVETMIAKRFGVQGFPTLILFPAGPKKDSLVNLYDGPRRSGDLVNYGLDHASGAAEAEQLLDNDQLMETCGTGLCVITFLPHIIDSKAKGRNEYLEKLNHVVKASKTMPVKFLWSQAGDQFGLEEQLHLAFGYPAVVAINLDRKKYTVHRGDFGQESVKSFLTALMTGTARVTDLPNLDKLTKADKWDGKDAQEPQDDEL
eukprot:Selendium_serpulae@DN2999_c0_g1_i1.p1